MYLEVEGLKKSYDDFVLDVSFTCQKGEIVSILGPSGAGKSTLLRMLAGLIPADSGTMKLDGHELSLLAPQKRGIGMVFQDFALFGHLNAGDNVAYGLKIQGVPSAERRKMVDDLLSRFSLDGFRSRRVDELSGGEQQRLALARALAVKPRLMLFDEPLGSLDASLRKELRQELRLIQKEMGYTSITVTHDQDDALSISDRVLVMEDGRIVQNASPEHLWRNPATPFVASFVGSGTLVPVLDTLGVRANPEGPGYLVATALGPLMARNPQVDKGTHLFFRAESVSLLSMEEARGGQSKNTFMARVTDTEFLGRAWLVHGRCGDTPLRFMAQERISVDSEVYLSIKPEDLILF